MDPGHLLLASTGLKADPSEHPGSLDDPTGNSSQGRALKSPHWYKGPPGGPAADYRHDFCGKKSSKAGHQIFWEGIPYQNIPNLSVLRSRLWNFFPLQQHAPFTHRFPPPGPWPSHSPSGSRGRRQEPAAASTSHPTSP